MTPTDPHTPPHYGDDSYPMPGNHLNPSEWRMVVEWGCPLSAGETAIESVFIKIGCFSEALDGPEAGPWRG